MRRSKNCSHIFLKAVILLTAQVAILQVYGKVAYQNNLLELGNDKFSKSIFIQEKGPGPVKVVSLLSENGTEILADDDIPYFEFVINNQIISSLDPLWTYDRHEIREMGNGGTEIKTFINGKKQPVKGLNLVLYQQIFPGTTLVREKIGLVSEKGRSFRLNKLAGKLHFIFPQYAIKSGTQAISTELRIASWASEIIEVDEDASFDERFFNGRFNDHNLANNHMFHPRIIDHRLSNNKLSVKGPVNIVKGNGIQWISAYEHASQDDLKGLFKGESVAEGGLVLDAGQGTNGTFNFPVSSKDFQFLGIAQKSDGSATSIGVEALRGAYLDGEVIDSREPYYSVWTASAFSDNASWEESQTIVHDYLWRCICEKPASRKPEFYYNTWGMQRRVGKTFPNIRDLMTEENIIDEIRRAAELGVDIFVLDDGWEQAQGNWTPHAKRLPNGLAPIKEELDKHGIKMGIWLSPMGIDSTQQRYKEHPEWVIKDSEGIPIGAQWGHPAFDFVSGFYDLFVEDCKKLVDAGARFFKWDAINTFYSCLPNLDHGSDAYSEEELRARYEYLLPIYVTRAMKELTDYEPELVIEIDLTEARRVMTGLAPLSQGKLFWMNNGASGYHDYTVYRTKSMRSIPNRYAGLIPLELFTFANYPQNASKAMRYNLNTSLVAGHGFWGALNETSWSDREFIKSNVEKSKRVLPYLTDVIPQVVGKVGDSPEIYTMVNKEMGAGQVIAFSGAALNYSHLVDLDASKVLGILNHAYNMEDTKLKLNFQFPMADASREAFIIPNKGGGISIVGSTSWLNKLALEDGILEYQCGATGEQQIIWSKKAGKPRWKIKEGVSVNLVEESDAYYVKVKVIEPETMVRLYSE